MIAEEKGIVGPITVIENGIDIQRFSPLARDGSIVSVGMVANLRPVKCPGIFLRAAAIVAPNYPDVRFSIAGQGPLREMMQFEIIKYCLADRFTLVGPVTDVPAYLHQLDIGVLCSFSEGLSNAILEYMAAGKAVVATAVGGNVHLIEDGVNGLLVPANDPAALSRAIISLVNNKKLRKKLGIAAREFVRQHYCQEAFVKKYQAFYQDLVSGQFPKALLSTRA